MFIGGLPNPQKEVRLGSIAMISKWVALKVSNKSQNNDSTAQDVKAQNLLNKILETILIFIQSLDKKEK